MHVENDKPEINELYQKVVSKFAVQWEELGLAMGLEKGTLDIISSSNKYNPNRAEDCCRKMLADWLKVDPLATWSKLEEAITQLYNSDRSNSEIITFKAIHVHKLP